MTHEELQMEEWERRLAEGLSPWIVFGTRDFKEIGTLYRAVTVVKALRRCKYSITRTAEFLGLSRNAVTMYAQKYIPNYRKLKTELKRHDKRRVQRTPL